MEDSLRLCPWFDYSYGVAVCAFTFRDRFTSEFTLILVIMYNYAGSDHFRCNHILNKASEEKIFGFGALKSSSSRWI